MSRYTTNNSSNGEMQKHQKKLHGGAQKTSRKGSQKPMKSNITAMKTKRNNTSSISVDIESEENEGDSSAVEEHPESGEEPAVDALSGASSRDAHISARRLAGHTLDDDMFMTDTAHTVEGAEREIDGSEDDNDYAGVQNVSDSDDSDFEDDERTILRSAEQDLIDEFENTEQRRNANSIMMDLDQMGLFDDNVDNDEALARRLNLFAGDSQVDDFSFGVDMNQDPFCGLPQDASGYLEMYDEAESAMWRMPEQIREGDSSNPSSATVKRVRFKETASRSPSMSESEDPNEAFPDLFASSDNPTVKQRIARGLLDDAGFHMTNPGDTESCYDFEDEDEKLAFAIDEESDSDDDSDSYDSEDEGDSTDEETLEEQVARLPERKKAAEARASATPSTPLAARQTTSRGSGASSASRPSTPKTAREPASGSFDIDPTRASMTTDAGGRRIKLLPPTKPLDKDKAFWDRARRCSRRSSLENSSYMTIASSGADSMPARPFTAESTLGSMFNGNLDILRNNDTAGIAEDLFPQIMNRPQTAFSGTTMTEDSDTDRPDINLQDFIDMDDSDTESDQQTPSSITSPTESMMFDSFVSNAGSNEGTNAGLLNHFDQHRGIIGSFRRNQNNAKHMSSLALHPAKRASAHEYNALQKGRRGAANTPLTPARKKRVSQDLTPSGAGVRKSLNSPLSGRRPRSRGNSLALSNADLLQTLGRNVFE